jgi:hypothetical protein
VYHPASRPIKVQFGHRNSYIGQTATTRSGSVVLNSVAEPRRCVIGQRAHDVGALGALGLLLVVVAVTLVAASPAQAAPVVVTVKNGMSDAGIVRTLLSDDEGDGEGGGDANDGEDHEGDLNPDGMDRAGGRGGLLLSPAAHETVSTRRPPLLTWMPVRGARYYNVQLFRGAHKVLSAWPKRPRYQTKRRWTHLGTRQRLRRGRYRWYVWPGFGARPKARYGGLIGGRAFTVMGR